MIGSSLENGKQIPTIDHSQDGREQLLMLTDAGKKVNKEHEQYEKFFGESNESLLHIWRGKY